MVLHLNLNKKSLGIRLLFSYEMGGLEKLRYLFLVAEPGLEKSIYSLFATRRHCCKVRVFGVERHKNTTAKRPQVLEDKTLLFLGWKQDKYPQGSGRGFTLRPCEDTGRNQPYPSQQEDTNPTGTLILDFQLSKLLFKAPSLWHFVMVD